MSLKKKLLAEAFGILQKEIEKFKGFLKKPKILLSLSSAAMTLLNKLLDQLKAQIGKIFTDDEAIAYVKNNRDLQKLLGIIDNDIDDSHLNDIVLACANPDYYSQNLDNFLQSLGGKDLSAEDYIKMFDGASDFDQKTAGYKTSTEISNAINKIVGAVPWLFMAYVIVLKVKELLTKNDNPSPHRGKYLQRLIRTLTAIIKQKLKDEKQAGQQAFKDLKTGISKIDPKQEKKQLDAFLSGLKLMDGIITASLLASMIYLNNRKKLQSDATIAFQEIASAQLCTPVTSPVIPEIIPRPLSNTIVCPVDIDENIVPHIPIEEKLAALSCEITLDQDTSINEGSQPDIATKALYQNDSSANFNILVKEGYALDVRKPMATYNGNKVYPSVLGTVEKIEPNKIYVKDIADPDNTYLEELIKKTQDLYTELNDTKLFLKNYYVSSLYPSMLAVSITDDASTNPTRNTYIGISAEYAFARHEYDQVNSLFERQVQIITGKDNVEKNAKNETLSIIKDQLDEQEKIFYDRLKTIGESALNNSRARLAKDDEFVLFDYYSVALGESLNALTDPTKIEIQFRDIIDEFIRKRYVIDGVSKKNIEDKINSKIKAIELGLSFGNWFTKAMNVYQANKKLSDLKNWLQGLADKNTKLNSTEKTSAVNSVMFLFEFYLNVDQTVQKYTLLKKESSKKTETVKEGNDILGFTQNLWKRYGEIVKDLDGVSKDLDDISKTFTTYSIKVITGEQYRYYAVSENNCNPPEEEDLYLSPRSKKGYGDISYWFKYCSFATLASVVNPATSWSTGLPPPLLTPFPTVYIPAKAFETKWGFIVVGLTITGIYPFPWALFVNWSTEYQVPLADPTAVIKKEIEATKKSITNQLTQFKKDILKQYLDKAKIEIKAEEKILSDLQEQKRILKEGKPKRNRKIKPILDIPRYTQALAKWNEEVVVLEEKILLEKKNKMLAETKYKIVKDAYDGSPVAQNPDPKIKSIQNMEDKINKQFDKLDSLISKMDKFLAPLPISMKPETANFAFTVKNPKPIINMAKELNDNINYAPLDAITAKFEPKNEDLMKTSYGPVSAKTFNNFKAYKSALKLAMPIIVKSDPFPKYENLKPTNLPWMTFLLKEWAPTGAQTYGFPGFPPLPIG